jgi:copper transport protein
MITFSSFRRWSLRWLIGPVAVLSLVLTFSRAAAHANLLISVPPANAILQVPPEEIRLWFSEPLEARFSKLTVLDAAGAALDGLTSQVDSTDAHQLWLKPGLLRDGLYTVAWQVVSAADGHSTRGSFSFTVGETDIAGTADTRAGENIPLESSGVRAFNFWSLALLVGGAGFWLFVYHPALSTPPDNVQGLILAANRARRMRWLLLASWGTVGISGGLLLLNQAAITEGVSLLEAVSSPALGNILDGTRFGMLWLLRTAAWLVVGMVLFWDADPTPTNDARRAWVVLGFGLVMLLTTSLFSHSNAAPDMIAATVNDWLHLFCTALWIGGLAQFINVLLARGGPHAPSVDRSATQSVGALVGYFSNYARLCVIGLIVTGAYAAWLHVGSVTALLNTMYGQSLFIKLVLFVPLLVIAAVNLLLTSRQLRAGYAVWVGRLRGLIGVELALTAGVLIAVGVMTAVTPARTALAAQGINDPALRPQPFSELYMIDSQFHLALDIAPGWVGTNNFTVTLSTMAGDWVSDASLVRLRFEHETENVGRSELRLEHVKDGTYSGRGANLSFPGQWKIRATVQRPSQYDTVQDFRPTIRALPTAADPTPPLAERMVALSVAGLAALIVGGFSLVRGNWWPLRGEALLAMGLIALGIIMLASVGRLTG